jgi:formamidopyrimidine-DNA glycosylase
MPELPEVEATCRRLVGLAQGEAIVSVTGIAPPTLVGLRILDVRRHGKQLAATLSDGSCLALHLGMTGRIRSGSAADADPHVRATLRLASGPLIAFSDTRRFGRVAHLPPGEDPFAQLGPDALALVQGPLPGPGLAAALAPAGPRGAHPPWKDRALDQRRVAGLGNIAVIEAAHRAAVHPHRPVTTLTPSEWDALAAGFAAHLEATLADCLAADDLVYVSEGGPNPFLIYARAGEACPRCGPSARIERTVRAGRPTFACPACQPVSIRPSA